MTEYVRSKLPVVDLWMKGGALGVALIACYYMRDYIVSKDAENKELVSTIIGIVREQNAGLISYAAAVRQQTEVLAGINRSQEANNRLIETILLDRRTSGPRPSALAQSAE